MGDWFDEDDEDFDLAAVEARHAEMEAQEKLDAEKAGERPEASAGGIYPESDWEAIIEAVLFTMGNSVELRQLAIAINQCEGIAKQVVENLQKRYEQENRGMQIIALEDSYQMTTRARFYDNLILVAATPKKHILTDVILETLSIVAYKQPVTKAEITRIRGVASDHAVNRLVEYGLIAEVGRLDAPGRPALFATTEEFLRRFGVGSTTDLPTMKPEQEAEIAQEVQEEMQDYFPENPDTDSIEDDKKDADSEAAVKVSDEGESDGKED
jgi:segregation and condensation protein B